MTSPLRAAMLALSLTLPACSQDPPLAVADVDLAKFQGQWFEIAKLPRPTESGCVGTTANYRLVSDGKLAVQSECQIDGAPRRMIAEAVVTDRATPAKLSLDVGGFYGDYWILEVGKNYDYAVVGHPTRDYLWILSRSPSLEKPVLNGIVDRARANRFDVSRLEYTPQTAAPSASGGPATSNVDPPEYGCGLAPRRNALGRWSTVLGLALTVGLRLRRSRRA